MDEGSAGVLIITENEDKFIGYLFSRDGVYTTIHPSHLGINKKGCVGHSLSF
jgi:hypothetical protein